MNELIEKLAQECKLIGMRPHLDGIYAESLEAFAKLVAKECVNIVLAGRTISPAEAIKARFGL